jgi:uncharacterized protein YfiM (DUF2279 family)
MRKVQPFGKSFSVPLESQVNLSRMNKAAACVLVVLVIFTFQSESLCVDRDKYQHFGVSLLFGAAGESLLHYTTEWKNISKIGCGTAVGTLPGLIKEMLDSTETGNHFSGLDLAADFAGALCGAVLSNLFNNLIQVQIETERNKRRIVFSLRCAF